MRQIIKVACPKDAAPYSFYDDDGKASGFDVEMLHEISVYTGINFSFRAYSQKITPGIIISSGEEVFPGVEYSDTLTDKILFSEPYLFINNAIIQRKQDAPIKSFKELANKSVITIPGTKANEFFEGEHISANVIVVNKTEQALVTLSSGKCDYAIVPEGNAIEAINEQLLINLTVSPLQLPLKRYCFAAKPRDSVLISKINSGIKNILLNNAHQKLYDKWLNASYEDSKKERLVYHVLIVIAVLFAILIAIIAYWLFVKKQKEEIKTDEYQQETSERKRIEAILAEKESLLNQALDIGQIGSWVWDNNTNVLICSQKAAEILGILEQTDYTMALEDFYMLVHEDDREKVRQAVQKAYNKKDRFETEYRIVHDNGEIRYIRAKAIYSYDKGATIKMSGVMQDITAYKSARLKVEYSNRIYSVLGQVDEAIARYSGIQRLFKEVCRIAVEHGKFDLVWIGSVDERTGWVKVESSYGDEEGFLNAMKFSIQDNVFGSSTVGVAYRNDKYACFNDLTHDLSFHPAGREKLKRGFRSAATFLLRKGGKKNGTITFYTKELNFFNEVDIKLLVELADNISFAIDNVEKENVKKITRRALQESQEKYLSVFNAVSDPIFLLEQKTGLILDANEAAIKLFGYSYEELLYKKLMEISTEPVETEEILRNNLDIITNRMYLCKDGSMLPVEVMVTYFEQNNRRFVVVVTRDLTETIESREKLIESEKRYSSIFQNNRAVMVLFDAETGKFIDVNPTACEFYGYPKEKFLNMTIADINIISTSEFFEEVKKISNKESTHLYLQHKLSNGEIRDVESLTAPMNLLGRKVFYSIVYDITEKRKAELELIAAKEKAEEANMLKTSLLGNMSHELRTPLTGILGFSQILLDEMTDEFHKDMVDKILRSGKRLMTTLNSILNISEIESSRIDIKLSELNLAYSIRDLLEVYQNSAEEKNLSFEYYPLDKNIFIYADENFLKQIVESLVDNAIKYTETGGVKIIVDSESDEGKFWGVIKIIDTGIGIPENLHGLIFEEFRQVSEGVNRNFEGSGLGLTLAKKMINLLGGVITVESELGKGSVFTVKLPGYLEFAEYTNEDNTELPEAKQATDNEEEMTLFNQHDSQDGGLPLVLLVEDNYINSDVTIMFLKGVCSVHHAIDGETAINMASSNRYEAILMDINLGGKMNGIESMKEIRKIRGYNKIPAIALTGYAMSGDKTKLLKEGFDFYMAKPFEKDDIVNLVKQAIKNTANIK